MGDHKCKRGYPIAVFCGAQSMDIGSITQPKIEGGYALFFGPGHPANIQQTMTQSERMPSHLHNPKAPTTASTARRAELIAATRALQAIHELYQGKSCAHVCMDSAYVAKAWGSWIPTWEEEGWPGDEHVSASRKGSVYQGSAVGTEDGRQKKRSNKRLADEDLLRELAAIRRLYARAERKGTGAAHLYLIDRNSNPANKTARMVLENSRAQEFASPSYEGVDSRRNSFQSSRASMTLERLPSSRQSRQRSMMSNGSRRSSRDIPRESVAQDDRVSRRSSRTSTSGLAPVANGRSNRKNSARRPAEPTEPVQEVDEDVSEAVHGAEPEAEPLLDAETGAESESEMQPERKAAAAAPAASASRAPRPLSIKSAASAVTALDDHDLTPATSIEPAHEGQATDSGAKVAPTEDKTAQDGLLASAAATAAAFVSGMTGGGKKSPEEPKTSPVAKKQQREDLSKKQRGTFLPATATKEQPAAVEDPGVAVPEEPEVVVPAAAAASAPQTPKQKRMSERLGSPMASPTVAKKAATPRTPKVSTTKAPTTPVVASKDETSPVRSRKASRASVVEPKVAAAAPAAATAATASKAPAATPDRSGRLINYSSRKKKADAAQPVAEDDEEGAAAAAVPIASTTTKANGIAFPSSEGPTEETLSTSPAMADSEITSDAAPAPAKATTPKAAKSVKKQQSMPFRGKKAGGAAPSTVSDKESVVSSSSVSRRFRTMSSFGRSRSASHDDSAAVTTGDADKQPKRKGMKWFKREEAPPLPTSKPAPAATATATATPRKASVTRPEPTPAAAAVEESEAEPLETEEAETNADTDASAISPIEEEDSVAEKPAEKPVAAPATKTPTKKRSFLAPRLGRGQAAESSVSEDVEDGEAPRSRSPAAIAAAAYTRKPAPEDTIKAPPKSPGKFKSLGRSKEPKEPKEPKAKAEKPAKEPKTPKGPKEPFNLKKSMGKLLTLE